MPTKRLIWGILAGVVIIAIGLVAYVPAMRAGYIWDDSYYVPEDRYDPIAQLVLAEDGLLRIWTAQEGYDYWPLTYTMFWVEWRLWDRDPAGYHVVNIVLHLLGAVVLWRVLKRLAVPGAWLAGVFFAVHPVCAASVAWISERKNTLSIVFYLLAILGYLRFEQTRNRSSARAWYVASLVAFALGLLSKTSIVMLPPVLLGLAWWRRGRIVWTDRLRSIPFFILAAITALVTISFQKRYAIGEQITLGLDGFFARLAGAAWVVWFYLYKALLPLKLSMIYPRWSIEAGNFVSWLPMVGLISGFVVLWFCRRTWLRAVLLALAYFVVTLFPVLGFYDMSFMQHSLVADHFQYVSIVGILALVAGVLGWICRCRPAIVRAAGYVVSAALIAVLAVLTWRQASTYKDEETLWRDVVAKNPNAPAAHNNLGIIHRKRGEFDKAMQCYRRAIQLRPNHPRPYFNLGLTYERIGQTDKAADCYRTAVAKGPSYAAAHYSLAGIHDKTDELDKALEHYRKAILSRPNYAPAHRGLAGVYTKLDELDKAVEQYRKAIRIRPDYVAAHYSLGVVQARRGEIAQAVGHYRQAIRINANHGKSHYGLAAIYNKKGEPHKALTHYRIAAQLMPDNANVHYELGSVYAQTGKLDKAAEQYKRAIKIDPDLSAAHSELGFIYTRRGAFDKAEEHCRRAIEIEPDSAGGHYNLGMVYARKGQHEEAAEQYRKAIEIMPNFAAAHHDLGVILAESNRLDEAVKHFRKVIQMQPKNLLARNRLGIALGQRGNIKEAIDCHRMTLQINPKNLTAMNALAWLLATAPEDAFRDGQRAVEIAEKALELVGPEPPVHLLDTLAAAYAEAGRFDEAVATTERALEQLAGEQPGLAEEIRGRLALYKASRPYRQPQSPQ